MNKKLFSWKALAGLALLVAMGLTSCKQDTVVDPNDPYNTTKPVKPSSKIDGDYDWEVSITKTADLAAQWKTVSKDVIKAVAAAYVDLKFMPTGGINAKNVRDYLAYNKIIACGGSWMVKKDLIAAGEWAKIGAMVKEAADIVKEIRGKK